MYIQKSIVQAILKSKKVTIEYSGTHNSDFKNPLYGRRAYWRLYLQDVGFVCKVTTPVKSLNPKKETLDKLLEAELLKRLSAIDLSVDLNSYGQVTGPREIDPYSVKRLLSVVVGEYLDLLQKGQK